MNRRKFLLSGASALGAVALAPLLPPLEEAFYVLAVDPACEPGATAIATVVRGAITSITITNAGMGYTSPPAIAFT